MPAGVLCVFTRCLIRVCLSGPEHTDSSVYTCLSASFLSVCLFRKMTFGKVNELGQFIRESEPEPDAKKSKGAVVLSLSL